MTDKDRSEEKPILHGSEGGVMGSRSGSAPTGGVIHDYLATVQPGPVMGEIVWDGPKPFEATEVSPCWACNQTNNPETLFKPCNCSGLIHRHCFRKWRQGWINPRNYFSCPNCMTRYNMERIRERALDSEDRIRRHYRIQLIKLLLTVFLVIGLGVFAIAGISYGADPHKNVPVAIKYMLSSVVSGIPSGNATDVWEANFKDPNVRVWPYYTLFSIFIVSLIILFTFCGLGCTFDQNDYRARPCCDDCCPRNATCYGCYIYQPCPDCNCNCNCSGGGGGWGNCSGGDCKGGGEVLIVLLLIIVVAVILSALFVVIFYVAQKCALLYDRCTHMLLAQAEELEGDTIVLGLNETWRPLNAV